MGRKYTLLLVLMSVFLTTGFSGQNSCGTSFYDSGGPDGDYSNDEFEIWTFCPDNEGDVVTINFTLVDLENCCDDLVVFSGAGIGFILEIDLEEPASFTSLSEDGCLTIEFFSDGSGVGEGWEASITCTTLANCPSPVFLSAFPFATGVSLSWLQTGDASLWDLEIGPAGFFPMGVPTIVGVETNPYTWEGGESATTYDYYVRASCGAEGESEWVGPFTFTTTPECGDFFYDTGGPNGNYSDEEFIEWTFCPDNPGGLVTINFTLIDIENCCDQLSVFAGSNFDFIIEQDLEEPASFTSLSPDSCLTVTWTSDSSVNSSGWEASISCNPPPPCPNPSSVVIDNITLAGADFTWMENGVATAWDIEVIEENTSPTGIPSVSNLTENSFTWEAGETGTVYLFYVRAQCGNGENSYWVGPFEFSTLPACGDSFFDTGGVNGSYEDNELLTWTFCPDNEGDQVTLNFIMVNVESCCDDLQIFNGSTTVGPLEGDLEAPASFTSSAEDGCLTVVFESDGSVVGDGWEALITCNPPPPCPNPSSLNATNITPSGADLGWIENGDALAWDIEIVATGTSPTGVATVSSVTNPYQWTGGESGVSYDFYVRAQCGVDDETSYWIGPFQFTALPGCGDNFYDTGGLDGNYQFGENNMWTFCPDVPGETVILDFTFVQIDFISNLAVFNGDTTLNVLNPDVVSPTTFISTAPNGCLTVTFTSSTFIDAAGWEANISCTSCPPVLAQSVSIDDVNAFDANVSWEIFIMSGNYSIEYDIAGFTPGEGNLITGAGTAATISGLEENTTYDFYLSYFCADGELSSLLGPFSFTTLFNNDLGITNLLSPSIDCGLGFSEVIRVAITNFGAAPQALFLLNFSVNGVLAGVNQPQDGFYTGIVSNDSTEVFEFDLLYNFDLPGEYLIQLWTDLEQDSNRSNDTFSIILTKYGVPFFEDFEAGVIPEYMTTTVDEFVTDGHNNTSFVLSDNLFFIGDTLKAELPVLGPIGENDTLYFDYRYTDWSAGEIGAILSITDTLMVRVSEDCGETYEVIYLLTGDNHQPSAEFDTAVVPLGDYAGAEIKIQILGIYGTGDLWLDIDNINIPSCNNIRLLANVMNASAFNVNDGQVSLTALGGIAPYEYLWEDGDMSAIRTDLFPGEYTVTVTDRFGCSTDLLVEVSSTVSAEELPEAINSLVLMPNPTAGFTHLRASFTTALDARVEVVNLLGQTVWESTVLQDINLLDLSIDLSDVPAAIYLIRVYAAGQVMTTKLLKIN